MLIFLSLSGGVDSSTSALILINQKKELTEKLQEPIQFIGISHLNWPESKCCETNTLLSCQRFCETQNIPYYKVDCLIPFCQKIVDNFCKTYLHGKTPNPCVICNEKIRFEKQIKQFFKNNPKLKNQKYLIMTGHYAQIEKKDNHYFLKKAKDNLKDQSYMLYRLKQEQLSKCIFPLGYYTKQQVRDLAESWQLENHKLKDSQDACFLNEPYPDFIKKYLNVKIEKGDFVDQTNQIIGTHKGIINYTRGQRKGLNLSNGPWYVTKINPQKNQVQLGRVKDLYIKQFSISNTNWVYPNLADKFKAKVVTRYHAKELECEVEIKKNKALITLKEFSNDVSPGQSAVLYDNDYVIGGGII